MHIRELTEFLDTFLDVRAFSDPSYNGLQVEAGPEEIRKIATACTASLEAIDAAVESGADALIVHHGLFWKGADPTLSGFFFKRVQALIEGKTHLLAYHLPLDAHMEFGNNAVLSHMLGAEILDYVEPGNRSSIGLRCRLANPLSVREIAALLTYRLQTQVSVLGGVDGSLRIEDLAICSGSGSFILDHCKEPTFQALITGDVNEQTYHLSRETGTVVFVTGHHASEQPAVGLLGERVAEEFGLEHLAVRFNPELEVATYRQRGLEIKR